MGLDEKSPEENANKTLRKGGFDYYGEESIGPNQNSDIEPGSNLLTTGMIHFTRLSLIEAGLELDNEEHILIDEIHLRASEFDKEESNQIILESGTIVDIDHIQGDIYKFSYEADNIDDAHSIKDQILELVNNLGIHKATIVSYADNVDTALSIIIPEEEYSNEFKEEIKDTKLENEKWFKVHFKQISREKIVQATKTDLDEYKWSDFVEYSDDIVENVFADYFREELDNEGYSILRDEWNNDKSVLIVYDIESQNGYGPTIMLSEGESMHLLLKDMAKRITIMDWGMQISKKQDIYEWNKVPGLLTFPSE